MKVAISKIGGRGEFLAECPANPLRGLEFTDYITIAKRNFADQAAVNAYVTARGGTPADWAVLDLTAAGVQ